MREGSLKEWLPDELAGDFELASNGRSGRHRRADSTIRLVEITALDVSSSDIRERLREGRSLRYLLPESIREAVERSGIYGAAGGDEEAR